MTPREQTTRPDARLPLPAAGERSVVVGLGRTGLSCARYLQSRGVSFAVTDSRAAPPETAALEKLAPGLDARLGGFDQALLDGASQVVASPGVSLKEPFLKSAAARGIPIVGDIELFVREAKAPIAAITGTNGKSTVTTLVGLMANAAGRRAVAGGNLGRPALDLLDDPVPELYVLELSSFQLETTHSLRAAAATVLNVTPDHMDRYDTVEEYVAAKERIFQRADASIVNLDDAAVRAMRNDSPRVLRFSLSADSGAEYHVQVQGEDVILMRGRERLVATSELKIRGLHNAANALASLAMCEALDLSRPACLQALREFAGLPHRSQWVADIEGVRFVDDSKGTNVGATLAAVAGMPGSLVLIAGGQGKGQDFAPLAQAFRGKVRHVVLIGQDAKQLDAALQGVATTQFAIDMNEAVQLAANAARPGETVLLSPACASLDMFRDYGHRGDVFAAAVRGLQS
ncbi:UDP-N-acetylmuramoyl-L-alanine--D-glutamate ligase [Steroidobacter sp. S1-65]|uniref:UDP-N-acetylmuramoylalanine--D-glutamate ligase n=1 Tax=Steroidobacter gossypii TaxID=2805490 RepID=A0ABS1X2R4_9GAMM|nr:UDP-N-acetylmuramoyl-L-alanine--D-glutamate ligase [Steroidobacter gossypii]MBM0107504.1 UDP-N-acetylmuramoyl-L-alanine--D-glutamate ligase [Steroidobacter gossypii]